MAAPRTTPITRHALLNAGWTDEEIELPIVDGGEALRLLLVESEPDPMVFLVQDLDGQADHSVVQLSCGRFMTIEALERPAMALRGNAHRPTASSARHQSLEQVAKRHPEWSTEGTFIVDRPL